MKPHNIKENKMSKFARVNGDLLPVLNYDTGSYVNSGPNAVQSGATVQPQGPALAFFTVTGDGPLTGTQVTYAIRAAEQLATVHIYEFTQDGDGYWAIALYPIDAWVATSMEPGKGLQEQIRAALTAAGGPDPNVLREGAPETVPPPA